jgi:hypothetical protein
MKTIFVKVPVILSIAAIVFLAGCASTPTRISEPVGPAWSMDEGQLIVHAVPRQSRDLEYGPKESSYTVFDLGGRQVETVTTLGERIEEVPLPAGWYLVRRDGLGADRVEVDVEIVPGRVTEVFLDHIQPPAWQRTGRAVHGPNGSFIGWRANAGPNNTLVSAPQDECPSSC